MNVRIIIGNFSMHINLNYFLFFGLLLPLDHLDQLSGTSI